jgi:hypothetical protein
MDGNRGRKVVSASMTGPGVTAYSGTPDFSVPARFAASPAPGFPAGTLLRKTGVDTLLLQYRLYILTVIFHPGCFGRLSQAVVR